MARGPKIPIMLSMQGGAWWPARTDSRLAYNRSGVRRQRQSFALAPVAGSAAIRPMDAFWQNVVAIVVVLAACAYIARAAWKVIAGSRGGCASGCSTCPASSTSTTGPQAAPPSFVPVDDLLGSSRS